jgi:hypothetical protein
MSSVDTVKNPPNEEKRMNDLHPDALLCFGATADPAIRVGDVRRMSAGTGISHSEYNASQSKPVHFLQIWIVPDKAGLAPGYEQKAFPLDKNRGRWTLIASKERRADSVAVQQDAEVSAARFAPESRRSFASSRVAVPGYRWERLADIYRHGMELVAEGCMNKAVAEEIMG